MAGKLTHVSVQQGVGHNLMSPPEFARLPINQRIELVLANKVAFLDDDGRPIAVEEAIDQLTAIAVKR